MPQRRSTTTSSTPTGTSTPETLQILNTEMLPLPQVDGTHFRRSAFLSIAFLTDRVYYFIKRGDKEGHQYRSDRISPSSRKRVRKMLQRDIWKSDPFITYNDKGNPLWSEVVWEYKHEQ